MILWFCILISYLINIWILVLKLDEVDKRVKKLEEVNDEP